MARELFSYATLYNDANLVHYYRLEGNSNDSKGSLNGTDSGISYGISYGKFSQGASPTSAGANKYINLGNTSELNFTSGDFSFNFWYSPQDSSQFRYLFIRSGGFTVDGYFLQQELSAGANVLRFFTNQSGAWQDTKTSTTFPPGGYYMITVTRSGSSVKIYKDGSECSYTTTGTHSNPTSNTSNFYFTGDATNSVSINGYMDDFAIFTKTLTSTEISNLYNAPPINGFFNFF